MCIIKRSSRDQKIVEHLNRKLYEIQKSGELCDFELTTEDGGVFKVHKWVLSTASPFFLKLLNKDSGFSERERDTVLIRRVSSGTLENIIKYMYTGEMEISSDTAKDIIDTALFLNLPTLVDNGIQILIESLDEDNCLDLLIYSDTCLHYGDELKEKSLKLLGRKIKDFMNLSDFLELPFDIIKMLTVNENSTENLYLAVKNWLTYDLPNREHFVGTLMKEVRFEVLPDEFVKTNIFDDNPLLRTQSFQEKIYSLVMNNWKKLKIIEDNLYCVLGNEMLLYDNEKCDFSKTAITRIENKRKSFGYTTFDKSNIFVCGGLINDATIIGTSSYFSIERNEWKDLPSMNYARNHSSSITVDNKIYVCGGNGSKSYAHNFIKTVEVFDINKSTWSNTSDFNLCPREYCRQGLCDLNKCLYYTDGTSMQRLDTRQSHWEILCRSGCSNPIVSAQAYDNFIYGFSSYHKEILTFDIRINKWLEIMQPNSKLAGNYPFTCVVNDRIYVFSKLEDNNYNGYELQTRNLSDLKLQDNKYGVLKSSDPCHALFSL